MSSSRTLSRKFRTFFICIKPRFDPSIILLYIAASVEQYCYITQVNALPENEGILEVIRPVSPSLLDFPRMNTDKLNFEYIRDIRSAQRVPYPCPSVAHPRKT